uniref:tRNA:m(4)X modification enzyme TRM13 n=1 Tax=Daphnia magna TaxID=35525 RepID=A0A0P6GBY3_9CRUS
MASSDNTTAVTCAYFLQTKKRYCRMSVKPGRKFCGEHASLDAANQVCPTSAAKYARTPCPYDPNHSCFVSQLAKHMEKCNSKPKPLPEYIKENINVIDNNEEIKVNLGTLSDEELLAIIARVCKIHSEYVGELPVSVGRHPVLETTLASLTESRGSWRHVFQSSSILYNMTEVGVLTSGETRSTYVEFGSGRGQLSYAVGQAVDLETDALLMIDKSSPRHKHDNRYKVDGESHASIHRVRADIADVDLGQVPLVRNDTRRLVGIGKHLCGAATDLALNCLYRANNPNGLVQGVCIALCCHHQCTWRHYVGKAFFKELNLSQTDFAILRAMTSWAVCGSRQAKEHSEAVQDNEVKASILPGRYAAMGLDIERRENIGRQCKQIIDRGRVEFLSSWPLQAKLLYYVEPDISPENVLLLAHAS